MAKRIAVGEEDFTALRESDSYYVDKTELLYDLVEANNTVTLFTRPRRFGKTLTMKMMESFFNITMKDRGEVFDGLAVKKHTKFCEKYMNQYPTLFLSLKDVEARNFDVAYGMLKTIIADLCKKMSSGIQSVIWIIMRITTMLLWLAYLPEEAVMQSVRIKNADWAARISN